MPIVPELLHILVDSISRNIYCMHLPLKNMFLDSMPSVFTNLISKEHFCQKSKLASMVKILWSKFWWKGFMIYLTDCRAGQVWDTYLVYSFAWIQRESPWLYFRFNAKAMDVFWFHMICILIHFRVSCIAIICRMFSYTLNMAIKRMTQL